jgi:hypothetical protein
VSKAPLSDDSKDAANVRLHAADRDDDAVLAHFNSLANGSDETKRGKRGAWLAYRERGADDSENR